MLGSTGFRSGTGEPIAHRLLPLGTATLIIDFISLQVLVTGPRANFTVDQEHTWGYGMAVGLTPAGAPGLLGIPLRELVGHRIRLADLPQRPDSPWRGDRQLAARLRELPDWPSRFSLLNQVLTGWSRAAQPRMGWRERAWWQLQQPTGRVKIGALADRLGVSRRYLEQGFQREYGMSPASFARIARLQRAVYLLSQGNRLSESALDSGYADQPHFTRDIRAMTGLRPTELCAILQYRPLAAG